MISTELRRVAERQPDKGALVGVEEVSYAELLRRIDACAAFLQAEMDLQGGDRVLLSLPNCVEFVVLFFAVAQLGGILVPVHPLLRRRELEWYLESLEIDLAVAVEPLWSEKEGPYPRSLWLSEGELLEKTPSVEPTDRRAGGDEELEEREVLYLSTSGTTGVPRIVPRTHRALISGAGNVARAMGVREQDRFFSVVPFHHANGLANCLLLPLFQGARVILAKEFFPGKTLDLLERESITFLIASPFIFRMLGREETRALPHLRCCFSTGAPLTAEVASSFLEKFGVPVRELYGSSETGTISLGRAHEAGSGRVGPPIPGVAVRVYGPEKPLEVGKEGEIFVRSPAMMKAYADRSGEPALFRDGYLATGDLGRVDDSGEIQILGRRKSMINVAGVKVDPREIEQAIMRLDAVKEVRVSAIPDRVQGELIEAVLVCREGEELTREEVVHACRRDLAEFKIPRIVKFVEASSMDLTSKKAGLS